MPLPPARGALAGRPQPVFRAQAGLGVVPMRGNARWRGRGTSVLGVSGLLSRNLALQVGAAITHGQGNANGDEQAP